MINTSDAAPRVGDGHNKSHGRWRLNSGSEMMMQVDGLSKKPIRTVIDFASAKMAGDRIVALADHDTDRVIGYWDRGDITSQGFDADLHVIEPENDHEGRIMDDAIRVRAIARSGVPIQVSVTAEPSNDEDDWQLIEAGQSIKLNGREYHGDGDYPLYILKNARITEGSIVTFGADSVTGRIAARKTPPVKQEATMSDMLKKLLGITAEKHHGLVARLAITEGKDEAFINQAIHAAEMSDKDKDIEAKDNEIKALKVRCEELEAKVKAEKVPTGKDEHFTEKLPVDEDGFSALRAKLAAADVEMESIKKALTIHSKAAGSKTAVSFKKTETEEEKPKGPATLTAAMNEEINGGSKLKGVALRNFCIAKYPNAERA